jgi:hypothetical protein
MKKYLGARGHSEVRMLAAPFLALVFAPCSASTLKVQDPLPSWNDTAPKKAMIAFVEKVTKEGSPDFVKPEERIATFDNDGTLWAEQPIYFQFQFALDRVKALAPQHPEWKHKEPFNHLLAGDMKAFLAGGEKSVMAVMAPPGYYAAGAAVAFGTGVALGAAWGGSWGWNCGWGHGDVNVALYPDQLLSQTLVASTYPLEGLKRIRSQVLFGSNFFVEQRRRTKRIHFL